MAEPLRRFREEFSALRPEPGAIVSLCPERRALTREVKLLPIADYLDAIVQRGRQR